MRAARFLVAVLAALVLVAPTAAADARYAGGRHPSVVPADRVRGNTGGRLLGDWFVENLSRPKTESPFTGGSNLCLDVGRRGKVLIPAGGVADTSGAIEMACTVKVGRPVVLVMTSADCSTAEPPPFYAATAGEQRSCAIANLKAIDIRSITVSVDGGQAVDIFRPRFLEVSPQRDVVFPEDPVFDAAPGPATFVGAAWMAEIRGLKRGAHTVEGVATYGTDDGPLVLPFVVHLDVVRR